MYKENPVEIIKYKGKELKVVDTTGTYINTLVVIFEGQHRLYRKKSKSIIGGDNKLNEAKLNQGFRGSVLSPI
ncbi:hypothetical protein HRH10_05345 [Enterococcus faecalis]|nr:hypothetical protein [Enterococcus faecalis]